MKVHTMLCTFHKSFTHYYKMYQLFCNKQGELNVQKIFPTNKYLLYISQNIIDKETHI